MWLATKYGFYSIVQKQTDGEDASSFFHIRARVRQDLENLINVCGLQTEIQEWPNADYRYRIIIERDSLSDLFQQLSDSIDYSNFKSMIARNPDQQEKLDAYHIVWHTMAELQK